MSERPSRGEQIAGLAGLVLILVMFLFAWYGVDVSGVSGFDAFDAFDDWVNIILVFTAFAAMSLALFGSDVARASIPLSVIATVLGGISAVVILIYIISPPGIGGGEAGIEIDLGRKFGVWLGLASAIGVALGGFMAMQEEGASFQQTADRLGGGPGEAPLQPPASSPPPPPPPPPPPGSAA
ncbi:MAG: hypothetical protein WD810_07590 [Solirubrobacterales bacterium]